jgi:Ala-tRNA(Pro) deacylase
MDLAAFLAHHAIEAKRFEHPPVMTVAESERLVPGLPGAKTKNLFLRDKKGARHILVTVPHDLAVDLNSLGLMLGAGRLGFGSAERLMKHLGVTPGSVSLLALVNDATMVIPHRQLERFLAATGHVARVIDVPGRLPGG